MIYYPKYCTVKEDLIYTEQELFKMNWLFYSDYKGDHFVSRNNPRYHKKILNNGEIYMMVNNKKYLINIIQKTVKYRIKNPTEEIGSNFRGYELFICTKKWIKEDVIDMINSQNICQVEYTQNIKVYIEGVQISYIHNDGIIKISIESCNSLLAYQSVMSKAVDIFTIYEKIQPLKCTEDQKKLRLLRAYHPSLFISGYTRNATSLPDIGQPGDFEFPKDSGKYYKAPIGKFIGLKKSNLSNKEDYPYIINCYTDNHMKNANSIIYKYVYNLLEEENFKNFFDIFSPKNLEITNYEMLLQEYYNYPPEQIMGLNIREEPGEKIYRIFEEFFNINIIVVEKRNNVLKHVIPECPSPYFWDFRKGCLSIVILKVKKKQYKIFNTSEEHLESIISSKLGITLRSEPVENAMAQYVDFYGKRRMYINFSGQLIQSAGRPIKCPEYSMEPDIHKAINSISFDVKSLGSQRHFITVKPYEKKKKNTPKGILLSDSEDDELI